MDVKEFNKTEFIMFLASHALQSVSENTITVGEV